MTRAVLTFHSIDDSASVLSFPVRAFAALVEHLLASDTPILSFDDLRTAARGVTLTFDDGMATVARHALPVLRDAGAPAHLFLTTGRIGLDNRWDSQPTGTAALDLMDWGGVEACAAGGMTIESHTATHPDLRVLPRERIIEECAAADDAIEQRLGRRPRLFAYPYGRFDARAREVAANRYTAAFTTQLAYFRGGPDAHCVPRIDTYYLRTPAVARQLFAPLGRGYIAARGLLRVIRGSQ